MCSNTLNLVVLRQRVNRRELPKLGSAGPRPLQRGHGWPLEIFPSHMCYPAKFGRYRPNGEGDRSQKFDPKVIGTDTDRSAAYDFLLAFYISTMGLYCAVSEISGDFSRKSQTFPTPVYLTPRWEGFPRNWVIAFRLKKTGMMGLPGWDRSLTSLAVWIHYTNVTDRRTDRHRPTASTALMHSVSR